MFHEVSNAPWRLCLCYNVYPTQTIAYWTGRLPEIKYKIQLFTRSRDLPDLTEQVYFIFLSSAGNLCKQFVPRSAPTECLSLSEFYWSWSLDPKYLTPWLWCSWKKSKRLILKKKISRWKQMHEKSPSMQIINWPLRVRQKHVFIDFSRCYSDFSRWYTIANDRLLHEMLPLPSTSCDLSTCKVWSCYIQPLR